MLSQKHQRFIHQYEHTRNLPKISIEQKKQHELQDAKTSENPTITPFEINLRNTNKMCNRDRKISYARCTTRHPRTATAYGVRGPSISRASVNCVRSIDPRSISISQPDNIAPFESQRSTAKRKSRTRSIGMRFYVRKNPMWLLHFDVFFANWILNGVFYKNMFFPVRKLKR